MIFCRSVTTELYIYRLDGCRVNINMSISETDFMRILIIVIFNQLPGT